MPLLISILLLAVGACEAALWQRLTCPHELKYEGLLRVWCRQSSAECCTGLTFSEHTLTADGGKVKVTHSSDFFTVAVLAPSYGQGVYWCGVLSRNYTIIKLAEGYIYSSSVSYVWSFTRWFLLPLLPMVTIFTTVYSTTKTQNCKKAEGPHDDAAVSTALTDVQYENVASSCEQ